MNLITRTDELAEACAKLSTASFIAVDTEFMREQTFWPRLCLIQIASNGTEILVDSLAPGLDLAPFFALMVNERVLKVFHSARQDIEIVHHLAGVIPHPIFDSQVAAMVCGFGEAVSYSMLVKRLLNRNLDKTVHPEKAWRRLKMRIKTPKALAVLMELAAWREREAQTQDVPRARILKDEALYDIASQAPRTVEDLGSLRTLHNGFARSMRGRAVLEAVGKGLERDPDTIPPIERGEPMPPEAQAVVDLLRVLLKATAGRHGVAPKLIATSDELEEIARSGEPDVPVLRGWRRKLFGEDALALKRGELALAIKKGEVAVIAPDGSAAADKPKDEA
jgi:ribonuclease D